MKNIDEASQAFNNYKIEYESYIELDISESDTRSKLIDKLFIEVLGWDEKDIIRESHVDSGYYDYRISIPGINFLIEAKRQFKSFVLPDHHKRVNINTLLKGNSEVLTQIRNYCLDEGVQYGIITNGYQIVLLKSFNTDGKPWKENPCLIFNGINDIESRFIEFYDNLSKFNIIHNGGFKFDLPTTAIESSTILSTLLEKETELVRNNNLSVILAPLINKAFGEIFSEEKDDDVDFIEYCFVENDETKKNKSEIERLFIDHVPSIRNIIPAVNSSSIAEQIVEEITESEISPKINQPPKPIIIIGSRGSGKTTFINHLFKFRIEAEDLEDHFIVYIDFRSFFEGETTFDPQKLAAEIIERLYDKYETLELHSLKVLKRIYLKEIKRNNESIWFDVKNRDDVEYSRRLANFFEESKNDILKHLELLSKYLIRERRKRLIVIIDNADQFVDEIQEKLFLFSHSLTRSTLCGAVISLREGYYRKWQNSPPFDAYESNIYHITAPKYIHILQKRIDYAIKEEKIKNFKVSPSKSKSFVLSKEYISEFLTGLKNSLFTLENSALIDFVNYTTYPNIREGLKVFKTFLTSGHTQISEYVEREKARIEARLSYPIIPIHEFIQSIALQNRHYYNSENSVLYNLLFPPPDSTDHLLKIYILKELNALVTSRNYSERLIPNETITEKLFSLGYKSNVVTSAISQLIKVGLVDTDSQLSDIIWISLPAKSNLYLTLKGYYYLNELINRFHYYDIVCQDTPIFDTEKFNSLKDTFPKTNREGSRNLELRKEFVTQFLHYLQFMEEKQSSQVKHMYGNVLKQIIKNVSHEIDNMKSSFN